MKQKPDRSLLPKHPHGARLAEIFNYGWKWLEMPLDQLHQGGEWKTNVRYKLKPRTLWTRWQDAGTVIGCRFGSLTRYGMIDIDAGSPFIDMVPTILAGLETVGIVRTVILRSSYSGGIHIYCPFPHEYKTFNVACLLRTALEAQGIRLAPGECEIFPNEKAYGKFWEGQFTEYNGHRLPLQPGTGSCILNDDLQPIEGGTDLARFFALWDNAVLQNDHHEILEALGVARANRRNRRRSTGPVEEWRADLLAIIEEGWTGHGQTNQLLKEIGTYGRVFKGLGEWELAEYILETATSAPGYEQYCQHHADIHVRCSSWARAVEKFYWPLGTTPIRERKLELINESRAADARDRIARAYRLVKDSLLGKTIRQIANLLRQAAACSLATLYKHRDLWHPDGKKPAPQPDSDTKPVTVDIEGTPADFATIQAIVRASLESVGTRPVTHQGGNNEACNVKTPDLKKFTSGGKEGGSGGKEGFSTGTTPGMAWPPIEWRPGTVADQGAG